MGAGFLLLFLSLVLGWNFPRLHIPKLPGATKVSHRKLLQLECTSPVDYTDVNAYIDTLSPECRALFNPQPNSTITCPQSTNNTVNLPFGACCDSNSQCESGICDPEWRTCTMDCALGACPPKPSDPTSDGDCDVCDVCHAENTCESVGYCQHVCPTYVGVVDDQVLNTSGCATWNNDSFTSLWATFKPRCESPACLSDLYPYTWEYVFRGENFGCSSTCSQKRVNDARKSISSLCYENNATQTRCGDAFVALQEYVATLNLTDLFQLPLLCQGFQDMGCCLGMVISDPDSLSDFSGLCHQFGIDLNPVPCEFNDCDNNENGPSPPNGCVNGVCQDYFPFDHHFVCDCELNPGVYGNLCQFVNCSSSPNCTAISREPCMANMTVPDTCGACLVGSWSESSPTEQSNVACTAGVACTDSPVVSPTGGVGSYPNCSGTPSGGHCALGCPGGFDPDLNFPYATCQNGTWGDASACTPRCLTAPEAPGAVGTFYCPNSPGRFGDECSLTCPPGYAGTGVAMCTGNLTTGVWNVSGGCSPLCPQPQPFNGFPYDPDCANSTEGTQCYLECGNGGFPYNPIICQQGSWVASPNGTSGCYFPCLQAPADTPAITYETGCTSRTPGTICNFICNNASLIPFGTTICQLNGAWYTNNSACVEAFNCSGAPTCSSLFRYDCTAFTGTNTCGACFPGWNSTPSGPGNTLCTLPPHDCSSAPPNCTTLNREACSILLPVNNTCGNCKTGFNTTTGTGPGNTMCIDCGLAPLCAPLNRQACTGGNTCGPCASGFVDPQGQTGPSNTMCVSPNDCSQAPNCSQLHRNSCTANNICGSCLSGYSGSSSGNTACNYIDPCAATPNCLSLNRNPCISNNTCQACLVGYSDGTPGLPGNSSCMGGAAPCAENPDSTGTNGATYQGCAGRLSGETCTPQCPTGTISTGSPHVTCVNGNWSASSPVVCTSVCSPNLPIVADVTWSNCQTVDGTVCSGSCSFGGSLTATCNTNTWMVSGQCVAPLYNCSTLPTVGNGTWSACGSTDGTNCAFMCSATFTGSPIANCNNGTWELTGSCECATGYHYRNGECTECQGDTCAGCGLSPTWGVWAAFGLLLAYVRN